MLLNLGSMHLSTIIMGWLAIHLQHDIKIALKSFTPIITTKKTAIT